MIQTKTRLNGMLNDRLWSEVGFISSKSSQRSSPKLSPEQFITSYRKVHRHQKTQQFDKKDNPTNIIIQKREVNNFMRFSDNNDQQQFIELSNNLPNNLSRIKCSLDFNEYQKSQIDQQSIQCQSDKINDIISRLESRQQLETQSQKRIKIKIPQSLHLHNPNIKQQNKIQLDPSLFGSLKSRKQYQESQNTKKEESFKLVIPTFYLEFQIPYKNFKSIRPSFIEGSTMAIINDKIYLYGGIGGNGMKTEIYEYNLKDMYWTIKQSQGQTPKEGRFGHTLLMYKNLCYLFGGSTMYDRTTFSRECFNSIYSVNLINGYWNKVQMQGDYFSARRHHKACLYGSKYMLIYGGIDNNEQILSDMALVNLDKNIWKYLGDKEGQELAYHSLINITKSQFKFRKVEENDNKDYKDKFPPEMIYCFGGKNGSYETSNNLKILTYDNITDLPDNWQTIQTKGQAPIPLYNHTLEYYQRQNCIIVLGGRMDIPQEGLSVSSKIYLYYINQNMWQQVTLRGGIQARCAHVSVRYGDSKIVLFGGIGDDKYLDAEIQIVEMDQQIVYNRLAREQVQQKKQRKQNVQNEEEIVQVNKKIDLWDEPQKNNTLSKKRTLADKFKDWQSGKNNMKSYLPIPKKRQPKIKYHLFQAFLTKFLQDNSSDFKKIFKNKDEDNDK